MMMVKAGAAVDEVIDELVPLLEPGDILIDGGNSHFPDSTRRTRSLKEKGILFIGTGVSGGEEGALKGPSIMPGGNPEAWPHVKPIFQAIAAKVADGTPCCDWVGPEGAGHFVKMVHNGIEYGDMQLICEAYHVMRTLLGLEPAAMHDVFARWNTGPLDSYLIEITRDILGFKDPETGKPMIDLILDTAGQKGTGKWTVITACDLGVPLTLISEAVFARTLSAQKDERVAASKVLTSHMPAFSGNHQAMVDDIEQALYASKIISYAQGFSLMKAMADESKWEIKSGAVALMWRGGCIIRSAFLGTHQGGVRPQSPAGQPAPGPLLQRGGQPGRGGLAARLRRCNHPWHPLAGDDLGPVLFRRLPQREAAGQPAAGPARLFRGPHLRARRPPARQVLPHQLDRPRRHHFLIVL